MLNYDVTETLKTIHVPTLVVPGDRDPVCCPEASAVMGRDIPTAQCVALTPARHMGLIEHHENFARQVDDFVAATGQPNPPANPLARGQAADMKRSLA
jgi:pimeloyl-ACP methyl ester carboxylesterase